MTKRGDEKTVEEMDCLEAIRNLYAYLDGELGEQSRANVEHHLGQCRDCYSRLEFEEAIGAQLIKHGKKKTPKAVKNRLRKLIEDF